MASMYSIVQALHARAGIGIIVPFRRKYNPIHVIDQSTPPRADEDWKVPAAAENAYIPSYINGL